MTFQRACAASDLVDDTPLGTELGGQRVALVRTGGQVYAIADECSHARILLSVGDVDPSDSTLLCYAHGARFDLATGWPLDPPASLPVPVYPTAVDGPDVLVDLDNPMNPSNPLQEY